MTRARKRHLPKDWKAAFLTSFRESGNVTFSARAAGVDRSTIYDARQTDKSFAASFEDAQDEAADVLEREAWRRAVHGVDKAVYFKDMQIDTVTTYSDTLMALLLKAHKPTKYRERSEVEHVGEITVKVLNGVSMDDL